MNVARFAISMKLPSDLEVFVTVRAAAALRRLRVQRRFVTTGFETVFVLETTRLCRTAAAARHEVDDLDGNEAQREAARLRRLDVVVQRLEGDLERATAPYDRRRVEHLLLRVEESRLLLEGFLALRLDARLHLEIEGHIAGFLAFLVQLDLAKIVLLGALGLGRVVLGPRGVLLVEHGLEGRDEFFMLVAAVFEAEFAGVFTLRFELGVRLVELRVHGDACRRDEPEVAL